MTSPTPITVAYGDGIGPEIMEATLAIIKEGGANLSIETIECGERIYKQGASTGMLPSAWDSLRRNKVLLKAPITTPQGGGYKSLNVTIRKTLGLYANIRPVMSYYPFINSHHEKMDLVIVRENEEDLYAGIEYQQTTDSVHAIKLITRSGCERIVRYAFEYAVTNGRKKVTCMSKDNIMKLCDGLFHRVFDEIAEEYPHIEKEHYIIDIGSARVACAPQKFDVIVTENLYGDILSDIAAETSGSVGLAGSANVGENFAMFEAIHGSAPDIAGQGIANPSGLLMGAVQMLVHIGQPEAASRVHNAWFKTLEDGIHTGDIYSEKSKEKVSTKEFASAVIARLEQTPEYFPLIEYAAPPETKHYSSAHAVIPKTKTLVGVDVFIGWEDAPHILGEKLEASCNNDALKLSMISAKGLKVWPGVGSSDMHLSDQMRCRFYREEKKEISNSDVIALLTRINDAGLPFVKTEQLYYFDGKRGFSLGQGE